MTKFAMFAVLAAAFSLAACVQDNAPASTTALVQPVKSETAQVASGPFAAVEGMVCRGYYKQSESGGGTLRRPESAFKSTSVKNGKFGMWAARAEPGSSNGWETASGNAYLNQGGTEFDVQSNGSWHFKNNVAGSNYYLMPVVSDDPAVKKFTIRYTDEVGEGWAGGKAECRANK